MENITIKGRQLLLINKKIIFFPKIHHFIIFLHGFKYVCHKINFKFLNLLNDNTFVQFSIYCVNVSWWHIMLIFVKTSSTSCLLPLNPIVLLMMKMTRQFFSFVKNWSRGSMNLKQYRLHLQWISWYYSN